MARVRAVAVLVLAVLEGCTAHQHASPRTSGAASLASLNEQPTVSSASPTPACGTAAIPAGSPNLCVAPPGYTGPLQCTAAMLQAHPSINQPAIVEVVTVMQAAIRVIATNATFIATQDVQADAQGHASVSLDISRAPIGVPVDVKIEAHLQDAPEADCATTFTPVATAQASSP